MTNKKRIASLDGLRAIAITLVILSHLVISSSFPGAALLRKFDIGNLGVRAFFVISGFLITKLLLDEIQATGAISFRGFYVRRLFRIVPAYFTFLCLTALAMKAGLLTDHMKELPIAMTFLSNYWDMHWIWGHTWSLSVEEQFYLLWPAVLMLMGSRALAVALLVLIIAPIFRILVEHGLWPTSLTYAFECVSDALATGCILALLGQRMPKWYVRFIGSMWCFAVPLLVFGGAFHRYPESLVKVTAYNFAIAILIDRYIRFPALHVGKLLNSAPLMWLGALSYSLYLWQQVFVEMQISLLTKLGGILGCAMLSYYIVERPLLEFRKRYGIGERVRSVGNDIALAP